jgi:hypothetical protein
MIYGITTIPGISCQYLFRYCRELQDEMKL